MIRNLSGKRIVITGASSGIGAATAIAFARLGAHVVIAARGAAGLDDIARRCRGVGGSVETRVVDVTDVVAVTALAQDAQELLGGIDLWFSCVGVGVVGKYQDTPFADHQRVIEANLISHMQEAYAVLPIFLGQDEGTWVNMISIGGFVATPYAAAYSASKFALRGFSEALRAELSKRPHIHVCDVYPTFVDTPAVGHAGNYTGAKLSLPPGSLPPEKVARAVVKLATHPRNSTFVGAPGLVMKLTQFTTPNVGPAIMNGLLDSWSQKAEPSANTEGSLFTPPTAPSGPDGHTRNPALRRKLASGVIAILAASAAVAGSLVTGRKRR
ncbi:MAG: short chain dehydrogenase [Novosphingobium pentaromativorans]|uniref:Short chain dehydrogenase n=1 Tax=Novosphingobium pentaromativorans TaxID=205844 RepID=A0A2W5NBE0_9SPHN|nr:SDR family oxidoreductase [Novosphingobium panipatense]PZQ49569.1 MAG: short chain dehydrogenase [Novosphingobium pentaromativorans]